MKILKILFPLSYRYDTPKKLFISLLIYIGIHIAGGFIPIDYLGIVVSIYVYIGGLLLLVNYLIKNKGDGNGTEQ